MVRPSRKGLIATALVVAVLVLLVYLGWSLILRFWAAGFR